MEKKKKKNRKKIEKKNDEEEKKIREKEGLIANWFSSGLGFGGV